MTASLERLVRVIRKSNAAGEPPASPELAELARRWTQPAPEERQPPPVSAEPGERPRVRFDLD
jgi:hypothetical protein